MARTEHDLKVWAVTKLMKDVCDTEIVAEEFVRSLNYGPAMAAADALADAVRTVASANPLLKPLLAGWDKAKP